MEEDDDDVGNKVIFLGETSVGKTNLIKVSTGQKFDPHSVITWSASYVIREFIYNNRKFIFDLWDTIGQEQYRSLTKIFFKEAIIVILVYDITNRRSFEELEFWYGEVKNEVGDEFILAIVGNKIDLYTEEQVSEQEGKKYAAERGAKFKLTSAKEDPIGFVQFLEELFKDYIDKNSNQMMGKCRGISIKKKDLKNNKNTKKCC